MAHTKAQRLLGPVPLVEHPTDPNTGKIVPIALVTDNDGPFRSFHFGALITARPELSHVRTPIRSPSQNGVQEQAFGSLKYERLYPEQIDDPLDLIRESEAFRIKFNHTRPHEALCWNRPLNVHLPRADPATLNFPDPKTLPTP